MTKIHESLVKRPICDVLGDLVDPRGEYVIVVPAADQPPQVTDQAPADDHLGTEFGYMTDKLGSTRRQAISALARLHRMPARQVYAAVERATKK